MVCIEKRPHRLFCVTVCLYSVFDISPVYLTRGISRSQWLFMNLFSVCGVFLQPEVKGYRTDCIIQIVCLIVSIKTSNTICGCEHSNFATGAHNLPLW